MKKLALPASALLLLFLLSAVNGIVLSRRVEHWQHQLSQAEYWADQSQWDQTIAALEESYQDWQHAQGYLHVVLDHTAVDDAEAMYHRARAFALAEEPSEFHAEIAHLHAQLTMMANMERFSLQNIL